MASEEPALTLESATQLRFPPFPAPPEGVTLIPFTAFRPSGIRVPIEDDDPAAAGEVELDGLGIPTIALRVKHAADTSEKKKKRKKKGGAVGALSVQVAPERPKTWWEVWEELEDIRRNAYNANETPIDRLEQAGDEFKKGRTWPTAQHGVQHVWDIFRIYLGLLEQVPAPVKETVPEADARSDDSDTDEDDADASGDHDVVNRLQNFLDDPELSMKIFFSSYFREKGLIWSEPRCQATPTLVSFFLRYLIRSRVFPEPEYERPIKRALEITELARLELPNSWKLGRALPDSFSDGCRGLWGSMQTQWVPPAAPSPDSIEEPGAKRRKMGDPDADAQESSSPRKTIAEEWVDIGDELKPPVLGGGWGTGTEGEGQVLEGWGDTGDSWTDTAGATIVDVDEDGNPNPNPNAVPFDTLPIIEAQPTWDLEPLTLLPLLGPTALPLTHTTGIVEQSTRRIVRIEPPRLPRILSPNAPAAEAVEEDLGCRLARVVLAPWDRLDARLYETGSDVLPPTLLSTSRGAAVPDEVPEGEAEVPAGAHRPWKDEIGVLVDPKLSDVFVAGMGLGAIWVEIVRSAAEADSGGGASSSSKKGKGKKKEVPKYWYMEQLVHQLPSFYIDKPEGDA